jgi:cobalt-zinc-cadmium efflux system protein
MYNHKDHNHKHHIHFDDINQRKIGIKLGFIFGLNLTITIVELVGGFLSNSLALISDSLHNFGDTLSILISYLGFKISGKPKDFKRTFGYKRAQIISAFINSIILIFICFFLFIEGIKKIRNPEIIESNLMLIVAIVGFLGNFFSILLLNKEKGKTLNFRSSYLHLLSDTFSSIGVIIAAFIIKYFNLYFIDGILTIIISLYIIYEAYEIFKRSLDIFMQSSANLNYYEIKDEIEKINGIIDIHHIHSWLLDENTIHFEAHIELNDMMLSDAQVISNKVEKILKEKFNISHTTLQIETKKCCEKNIVG